VEAAPLIEAFKSELPWQTRCTEWTARKSAYQVTAFMRRQTVEFPENFTRAAVLEHLQFLRSTRPWHRDKARRENSTVNKTLDALKSFAEWAVRSGLLTANPIRDLKGLRVSDPVMPPPEPAAVTRLLMSAREHGVTKELRLRNYAAICFLVDTGVRAAELLGLDGMDVQDDRAMIRGKSGKHRLVAVNPPVQAALGDYLAVRTPKPREAALWLSETGTRWSYVGLRNVMQKVSLKAGVSINLHDLRRFAHTHMWLNDISQIDGMLLSGHSDARVYERYIRSAMQLRALREHRLRSPLASLVAH
jgi:site-specific recombinase XerD